MSSVREAPGDVGLSVGQKVAVSAGFVVTSLWPLGPLLVAVLLYFTALRSADQSSRSRVIWAGLVVSIVMPLLIWVGVVTGAIGHFMYSVPGD